MKRHGKLSAKGAAIVGALERFRDAVAAEGPIEQRYTVRRIKLDLPGRDFGPEDVKAIRSALRMSQPLFGQFLGVDVKTVRSWEQGRRTPSGMARRFLEEIAAAPDHWRRRLDQLTVAQPEGRRCKTQAP